MLFEFGFMQNAVLAAVLISIACGVVGSLVIANRMAYVAGGVSHGAYGGVGISIFLGFSPLLGSSVFACILGVLIAYFAMKNKERTDAIIGALWAFGMAVGIIFIDLTPGRVGDLMGFLFGSILAVSLNDLVFMAVLDAIFILFSLIFYQQIRAVSFDAEFARLRGVSVGFIYYAMTILISLCVVAGVRVVGLILIIALLTIPPYIAESFSKSLAGMMMITAVLAFMFCMAGLISSYYFNISSGAAIILYATAAFGLTRLLSKNP